MSSRTFAIIKPDVVESRAVNEILNYIEFDFIIDALWMMRWSTAQAKEFYAEHKGKPFYLPLIEFMTSGPLVCLVIRSCDDADDAVGLWREIMGATDPAKAKEGTVRQRFGTGMPNNAVHGSDSSALAEREIALVTGWLPGMVVGADYFEHDCSKCSFLGPFTVNGEMRNLYVCLDAAIGPSIISRYGPGSEYSSYPYMIPYADRDLHGQEAIRRAVALGLVHLDVKGRVMKGPG